MALAYRLTKYALDVATRLVKARLRVHDDAHLRDDMAVVFVANHFTRMETLLVPYALWQIVGRRDIWALAAPELFRGSVGAYLRSLGAVSTRDPARDESVVRALLTGAHPWLIFPEGAMVKEKRVALTDGDYRIHTERGPHPPHTGAAVFALRAELHRARLAALARRGDREELAAALERFGLNRPEDAAGRHTVIVPVNITYYPMRVTDNSLLLRVARRLSDDLSPRALEELSIEGAILAGDTDIDITLGRPIDVRNYLEAARGWRRLVESDAPPETVETAARALLAEPARRLTTRAMSEVYRLTPINADHLLARLVRVPAGAAVDRRTLCEKLYLAADRLARDDRFRLHADLKAVASRAVSGEPAPRVDDFIDLMVREGFLGRSDGRLWRLPAVAHVRHLADFHAVRTQALGAVIHNELEPLQRAAGHLRDVAALSADDTAAAVRRSLLREERDRFEAAYARHFDPQQSHGREVGAPFLLAPDHPPEGGVVLVHGYMAAPLEMRALGESLVRRGLVVYGVRLAGCGTGPADLARTRWQDWYASVSRGCALVRSMTANVAIGGFSMGGTLALLAAARKEGIKAAFAINAPLKLRDYTARFAPHVMTMNALLKRVHRSAGPHFRWEYVESRPENPHINYRRNPIHGVRELGLLMKRMEAALPEVDCPVLVVQATGDPTVHPVSARRISAGLTRVQPEVTLLDRDRHGIINGDGAEAVHARVALFLAQRLHPVLALPAPAGHDAGGTWPPPETLAGGVGRESSGGLASSS